MQCCRFMPRSLVFLTQSAPLAAIPWRQVMWKHCQPVYLSLAKFHVGSRTFDLTTPKVKIQLKPENEGTQVKADNTKSVAETYRGLKRDIRNTLFKLPVTGSAVASVLQHYNSSKNVDSILLSQSNVLKGPTLQAATVACALHSLKRSYKHDSVELDASRVMGIFELIKGYPSELYSECVVDCVTAYVGLVLTVCKPKDKQSKCLNSKTYLGFEKALTANLEQEPLYNLATIYNTFRACRHHSQQSVIVEHCEDVMLDKLTLENNPVQVLALLVVQPDQRDKLWDAIEKSVDESLDSMEPMQLLQCLKGLANRADPTIVSRGLVEKVCQMLSVRYNDLDHDLHILSDIVYALQRLSAPDRNLLHKICGSLVEMKSLEISKRSFGRRKSAHLNKICVILINLEKLQWASKGLLDTFSADQSETILTFVILKAAYFNISLSKGREMCYCLHQFYTHSGHGIPTETWVQLLWSSCVLGHQLIVMEGLQAVFEDQDIILTAKTKLPMMRYLRDLAMIAGIPVHQVPFVPVLRQIEEKKKSNKYADAVFTFMKKILPGGMIRTKGSVSPAGHKIDIELLVDSNCEAVVEDFTDKEDYHRIAVKARGFYEYSLPDNLPLGWVAMETQNLTREGYTVLEVPYFEWERCTSDETKSAYILEKISKAVKSKST